jgi:hypothetical protein
MKTTKYRCKKVEPDGHVIGYFEELIKVKKREKFYIDGLHVKSQYTTKAHFLLIQQMVQANEWRFITDEDFSLINSLYRVFYNILIVFMLEIAIFLLVYRVQYCSKSANTV